MAIRDLSVSLNLDTSQFTARFKDAAGVVKNFTGDLDNISRGLKETGIAFKSATDSASLLTNAQTKLGLSGKELTAARTQYIASLIRERDTIGLTASELRKYEAGLLGIIGKTEQLRAAIDQKVAAQARDAEETAHYQAVLAKVLQEEELRVATGEAMVRSLENEILVMRAGSDALLLEQASTAGVTKEIGLLLAEKADLIATNEREAASLRAASEERARYNAAAQASVEEFLAQEAATNAAIKAIEDETYAFEHGTEALQMRKAVEGGYGDQLARLIELRRADAIETKAQADAERLLAEAARELKAEEDAKVAAQTRVQASLERQLMAMKEQIILHNQGKAAVAAFRAETVGLGSAMSGLVAEIAAADAEIKAFGNSAHGSSRKIYEMNVLLHETFGGRIRQAIGSFSILLSQMGLAAGAVLGLTLGIGVLYSLSKPLEEAAKHMEELTNKSKELGVSISMLQDLETASKLVGIKVEGLEKGVVRLDVAFANAKAGSKKTAQAFEEIGISTSESLTQTELFKRAIDGISKLKGPEQVAVTTRLLGRGAAELIPVIDKLGGSYDKINALQEKYGIHNMEAVEQGKKLAEQFNISAIAAQGLGLSFLSAFGPAINSFIAGMTSMVGKIGEFLRNGKLMKEIFDDLKIAAVTLGTFLTINLVGPLAASAAAFLSTAAADTLMGIAFGTTIPWVEGLTASMAGLNAAMLANPFVLVAGAAALLVGTIYALSQRNQEAKKAFDDLKTSEEFLKTVTEDLKNKTYEETIAAEEQIKVKINQAKAILAVALAKEKEREADLQKATVAAKGSEKQLGSSKAGNEAAGIDGAVVFDSQAALADAKQAVANYTKEVNNLSAALDELKAHEKDAPKATTATLPTGTPKPPKKDKDKEAYDSLVAELEKQSVAFKDLSADYERIKAGQDDVTLATERYRSSLQKNLDLALKYKGANNAQDLVDEAVVVNKSYATLEAAAKGLQELQKKTRETETTSIDLWAEYTTGASKSELAVARLKTTLQELVRIQPTAEGRDVAQSLVNRIVSATEQENTVSALDDMRKKTKAINEELMTDSIAKARAVTQEEIKQAYERIKWETLTAEEGKQAYATYLAFVKAENEKLATETPFGKLAQDWKDAMGNMTTASAGWASSFVQDVTAGKLNFNNFAASIVQDIAQIIVKALVAQYILGPLMAAFGPSVAPGAAPGSTPMFTGGANGFGGLTVPSFHTGGIVGSESPMTRVVSPSAFQGAMRYHVGGIAGLQPGETPAVLKDGEGVFTKEQMKSMSPAGGGGGSAAPPVQINLNNTSGTALDADHSGTSFDGEKYILDVVVSHLGRPGSFRNAMRNSQ